MPGTIRILVADDTDIAREGMRRILSTQADLEVIGEGATPHDTVAKAQQLHPDVLLLDLQWFGDEHAGIEVIGKVRSAAPQTRIIAITVYPHLIEPARRAGAAAAVNKEISRGQLIQEIRGVHALPAQPLPTTEATDHRGELEPLTERERQVLRLLAKGRQDKEIAAELNIAESTAKNHVRSILGKLGVPNRAGAVDAAYRLGLMGSM